MYVRMYLQKDKDIFLKDQELSQKDHSLCKKLQDLFEKVGRVFRKLQSLFERYTTAFYNSTQFPYIFHQPWIGFILGTFIKYYKISQLIHTQSIAS